MNTNIITQFVNIVYKLGNFEIKAFYVVNVESLHEAPTGDT